ncbi:MAG: DUF86 domain-containing protein [Nitrospirae bacterium]|nr:DUF86 domain-containing protein [Nitrospirota bacterium]
MSKRDWKLLIEDILTCANRIIKYTENMDIKEFSTDEKTIDAVMRNFQVIGEAVKNLPKELINTHKNIKWVNIMGLRNIIVHEYFGIDMELLWSIIKVDIPQLNKEMENLIDK